MLNSLIVDTQIVLDQTNGIIILITLRKHPLISHIPSSVNKIFQESTCNPGAIQLLPSGQSLSAFQLEKASTFP